MRLAQLSVRTRLALWHTVILAALLAASATVALVFLENFNRARTDADLADTWSAFGSELVAERDEASTLAEAATKAINEFRFNNVAVAVLDSANRILAYKALAQKGTDDKAAPPLDPASFTKLLTPRAPESPELLTLPGSHGGFRVYSAPLRVDNDRVTIRLARSLRDGNETIEDAVGASALVAPLVLLLAFIGGWFLAGRSLSPVGAMSARAARISGSTTTERLPVINPDDELGRLATVLNDLLDRVAEALSQQRRFMTDASHELRTPVAVVRAITDVVLSKEVRSEAEYREALQTVHRESRRLTRVVNDLFLLSRADIGERPIHYGSLYLGEVVSDASRDVSAIANDRNIRIECRLPDDGAPYTGDEELLDRAFGNLIDNAIKYSPAGSTVLITLTENASSYRVDVEDEGPGIPAMLHEKIFERFFRVSDDDARIPGAGLGLSIARWAVEAHGGIITVGDSERKGARFTIILPKPSADNSLRRVSDA